jgi:DegV family protein with EDD domain
VTVALVTDSTAYLPADLVAEAGIVVVPLHVVLGGQERHEGVDVTSSEVAEALRAYVPVSTSRPAPQAFLDAYETAAAGGAEAIVSVHLSALLSSTIGGAHLAAAESPVPGTVVDSAALGMVMGYAVASAATLAARGASPEEVADHVRRRCAGAHIAFYVDTLEHLRRGGRIGKASAFVGSALAIKPILTLTEGVIVPLEKVRTASRSIARLEEIAATHIDRARSAGVGVDVAVHHLDSVERAESLAERLRARVGSEGEVRVVELGAVVGAHVGPGTIAVAVVPRLEES